MKKKSIKFNFIMNAILSLSSVLFPIITFPYLTEVIKPEGTGKIGFAVSLVEYFNIFAQLGIPTYGISVCARVRDDREKLSQTAQELFIINIIMTFITYVVFAIALITVPVLYDERILYIIVSSGILLTSIGMEWLYKALEEYRYITIRSVIFKLVALIAMLLLVHNEEDYVIYGAISVMATSGSMILNFINARKHIDIAPRKKYDLKRHLKPVGIFLAMACATTVYTNLDTVMLKLMTTDTDTGYYYASIKIKNVLITLITSLGAVLLPRVSYYAENRMMDEFRKVIADAIKFVLIVATGAVFFFMMTAKPCILFLSKEDFYGSIAPMRILMPTVLLIGLSNILGIQILIPMKKEKVLLFIEIGGAVIDFAINMLLIKKFRASGAAIGTLVAEFFVTGILIVYLSKELKGIFARLEPLKIFIPFIAAAALSFLSYKLTDYLILSGMLPDIFDGYNRLSCLLRIMIPFFEYSAADVLMLVVIKERLTAEILTRFLKKKPAQN